MPADHSAGNDGYRYQYTVKGTHVLLRCVSFDADNFYEAQVDETGSFASPTIYRDTTGEGLTSQLVTAGVVVTDKAAAWLADANCAG
jgi:hypothetical protein